MPDRSDGYQLPSWPKTLIDRLLWNTTMADIHSRLAAREELEASFESLMAEGIQASLDYIQVNVAPQIANLQTSIDLAQQQIDQIIIGGKAPDTLKFGGQLPAYYATAQDLSNGLSGKVPSSRKVNGKELSADVTLQKSDVGLGNADNTADKDKPVSDLQKEAIDLRLLCLPSGAALPEANIGPIWHSGYNSVMTWQSFTANGAAYEGYASFEVGKPSHDAVVRPGSIKLNGASLSKTVYAALWNWAKHHGFASGAWAAGVFIFSDNGDGTFRVPDVRAEFFRSADDGRGVDTGRAVGSWQDSANKSHFHTGNTDTQGWHSHNLPVNLWSNDPGAGGNNYVTGSTTGYYNNNIGGRGTDPAGSHSHAFTTSTVGGAEARPRSTAFLACIKF
ncbi:hypothetical protein D3C80_974650 [compost metagenome]